MSNLYFKSLNQNGCSDNDIQSQQQLAYMLDANKFANFNQNSQNNNSPIAYVADNLNQSPYADWISTSDYKQPNPTVKPLANQNTNVVAFNSDYFDYLPAQQPTNQRKMKEQIKKRLYEEHLKNQQNIESQTGWF